MPGIPINIKERQESVEKMMGLPLPVHSYVPIFVKEALAKSFLKKPERYLQKLYQSQQQKRRETINPASLPLSTTKKLPQKIKKLPQKIKKLPQQTKKLTQQRKRYLKRKQLLDQLLYQQQQLQEEPDSVPITPDDVATPNTFTKLSGMKK